MSEKPSPTPPPTTTINPLKNIYNISDKKSGSSYYNVVTTTQHDFLSTQPVSIRINSNVIGGFRQWCKFTGKNLGEATAQAMIELMQNHQLPNVKVNFNQDIRTILPNTKAELRLALAKTDLRKVLDLLERVEPKLVQPNLPKLRKALNKAFDLKDTDKELESLFERSKKFLGEK